MSDFDMLISTLSAYMRKESVANEHKKNGDNEEYGGLIIAMHEKKYGFLAELANPDATPEDIWNKAASLCNDIVFLANESVRRKTND